MRWRWVFVVLAAATLASAVFIFPVRDKLVWNRTDSAPRGLYWIRQSLVERGDWVLVSAQSKPAEWAEANGYVGKDWPLIKQVAGLSGDRICRYGAAILINDELASWAREQDRRGRYLPVWRGCQTLGQDEVFLLNPHPRSLDGRYFGLLDKRHLEGVAVLIIRSGN
ncbi:S26 family signal peptidase [Henriciella sp.]|jgi:conjugative transfer signal peptidase TraF|uniref:S26 family signal peptidase n=1 Tax=Henriciella sp. TaxID=1968823 RepID=UPI000C4EDC45|nr:S26 family signal peptidase [Henriciella sp.]MAN74226.1 S26 family signal peptidase [Henriciella sp.]|tara:strand:- start:95 stop:595 length:501 start_codon:yes stop_codon:yes gene_type:complete